ncbi:MAG: hypothetical protein ACRENJ_03710, partial [Candidatus Eiseniibacteriota bacterium]
MIVALRSRTVVAAVARRDWLGLLAQGHFEFRPPDESLRALPGLLADLLRNGSDRWGLVASGGVALAAVVVAWFDRAPAPGRERPWFERVRALGLVVLALALYLGLPLHVYGLVSDLGPRFAPVVAALAVGLVP